MSGPGRVAIVSNDRLSDNGGTTTQLADGRYFVEANTKLPILGHTHAHWFITHAGEYALLAHAVAVKKDGTEVRSETFTSTFRIETAADDSREGASPTPEPSNPEPTAPEPTTPEAPMVLDEPVTIDKGHVDLFHVMAHNGGLLLNAKDGRLAEPVLRTGESVTLRVGENTLKDIP